MTAFRTPMSAILFQMNMGAGWSLPRCIAPNWHPRDETGRWLVSCSPCQCGARHDTWTCWCGAAVYAPKLGPGCRIRAGLESPREEEGRRRSTEALG